MSKGSLGLRLRCGVRLMGRARLHERVSVVDQKGCQAEGRQSRTARGRSLSAGQPLTDEKLGRGMAKASLGMVKGSLCLTGDGRRMK